MSGQVTLRTACADDVNAIARLHVAVWRHTYANLAPASALAALDEYRRLPVWRSYIDAANHHVRVAEQNGALSGVVCYGPSGNTAFEGRAEIKHLYVCEAAQRHGLGRLLMATAFKHLAEAGYASAALAVVQGNKDARAFYKALGGREAGQFTDPGPLWQSDNLFVVWDKLETTR